MIDIDESTLDEALALNNQFATELSWQTPESFRALIGAAYFARWTAGREGFLIAFTEGAAYDSQNYRWFATRHDRFVYIDRVVVRPAARGAGHARMLYAALFEAMRASGHRLVGCEVNLEPPNPASDAFHARLGFREAGTAAIDGDAKVVRYLVRDVDAVSGS
jgi:predicted GNAT superfamily acetyltransferase